MVWVIYCQYLENKELTRKKVRENYFLHSPFKVSQQFKPFHFKFISMYKASNELLKNENTMQLSEGWIKEAEQWPMAFFWATCQKNKHGHYLYIKFSRHFDESPKFLEVLFPHAKVSTHKKNLLSFCPEDVRNICIGIVLWLCNFLVSLFSPEMKINSLSKWQQRNALCVFPPNDSISVAMNIYGNSLGSLALSHKAICFSVLLCTFGQRLMKHCS